MFAGIWWVLVTCKKSQSRCASFWVSQIVVGKSARQNQQLVRVQVSVKFFIHHEFAVVPEEEEWQPGTRIKRQILRALLLLHRILETLANR